MSSKKFCLYTLGGKHTIFNFLPMLKRIIEDAFDSKVRSWLNSLEYVEEAEEQARVESLVHAEIHHFHRWMFNSECDTDRLPGIQSRYLLLEHGTRKPAIKLTLDSVHQRNKKESAELTALEASLRGKSPEEFKQKCHLHPLYILLCLLGDDTEIAFWTSLCYSTANDITFYEKLNMACKFKENKKNSRSLQAAFSSYRQNYAPPTKSSTDPDELQLKAIIEAHITNTNIKTRFYEHLKFHLRHFKKTKMHKSTRDEGHHNFVEIGADWKDALFALGRSYVKQPSTDCLFSAKVASTEEITGFSDFCQMIVVQNKKHLVSRYEHDTTLVAGVLQGPHMAEKPVVGSAPTETDTRGGGAADEDGPDALATNGADAVYKEYSKEKKQVRKFRLGQDLLSIHDIHPLSDNFYESARLEAYFRAKSAESRQYKKRRTEDAFGGFDDEFARVAHRKETFRHPLLQRESEKKIAIQEAIEMLVSPPTQMHWYKTNGCYHKKKPDDPNAITKSVKYTSDAGAKLIPVHVSEHLFQQEHAYGLWSFDHGIRGTGDKRNVKSVEDFFQDSSASPAAATPEYKAKENDESEYVLLPVTTGGNIKADMFVDKTLWWMVGDTFSLYTDALTLCLKFVNQFRDKNHYGILNDHSGVPPPNPSFEDIVPKGYDLKELLNFATIRLRAADVLLNAKNPETILTYWACYDSANQLHMLSELTAKTWSLDSRTTYNQIQFHIVQHAPDLKHERFTPAAKDTLNWWVDQKITSAQSTLQKTDGYVTSVVNLQEARACKTFLSAISLEVTSKFVVIPFSETDGAYLTDDFKIPDVDDDDDDSRTYTTPSGRYFLYDSDKFFEVHFTAEMAETVQQQIHAFFDNVEDVKYIDSKSMAYLHIRKITSKGKEANQKFTKRNPVFSAKYESSYPAPVQALSFSDKFTATSAAGSIVVGVKFEDVISRTSFADSLTTSSIEILSLKKVA